MIKILCPTDLSNNSKFALGYAINISNDLNAKLLIMTSYQIPRSTGSFRSIDDKIKEHLIEDLEEFVSDVKDLMKSDNGFEMIIMEGNASDSIIHTSKFHGVDLIVMGTMGSSGISKLFIGSITKKLFETSSIPILAIPSVVKDNMTGNKLVLCLDKNGIENLDSISMLEKLKLGLGSDLQVLHVKLANEKLNLHSNSGLLNAIVNDVIEIVGNDPVKEIKKYVDNNDVAILIMVGRKHSFWERLFFESNTTAELFATNVPILLLPE